MTEKIKHTLTRTSDEIDKAYADNHISTVVCNNKVKHS